MAITSPASDVLTTLAESYLERLRQGEDPAVEEYVAQCPGQAEAIRELFGTLRMVEALGQRPRFGGKEAATSRTIPGRLGDFQLIREIARGGMGIVYDAVQTPLGRRVAVKVLPPADGPDASRRLRFQREARAAGNLHHTNIVPVFEVKEENGICFYAMQFIEGDTLAEVWQEVRRRRSVQNANESTHHVHADATLAQLVTDSLVGGTHAPPDGTGGAVRVPTRALVTRPRSVDATQFLPPPSVDGQRRSSAYDPRTSGSFPAPMSASEHRRYYDNVARIVLQIADALSYAHSQRVLHRDIKPSNVILDTQCRAWLTDFGLARMGPSDVTETGKLAGTLRYMSPERFAGQVDERSDIYGAGLILYEFATLRPAFETADQAGMIQAIQRSSPPRPRACEPTIPRDLETIILCAIDRDPARRYASAEALALDLRCYLDGRPLLARRTPAWGHAWRWCRRNPLVATLSAGLFGVILIAWAATFGLWRRAENLRDQVQTNLEQSDRNLNLAIAAVNRFGSQISDDLRLKEQDLRPLRKELLQTAADFHKELLTLRADTEEARLDLARAHRTLGELTAEIGDTSRAIKLYQQAVREYESLLRDQPEHETVQFELALCLENLGHRFVDMGRSADAMAVLDRAIVQFESFAQSHPGRADARGELGQTLELMGYTKSMTQEFDEAQLWYRRALEQFDGLMADYPDRPLYMSNISQLRCQLAFAWISRGISYWRDAESDLLPALTLQQAAVAHPRATAHERVVLGKILRGKGRICKVSGRNQEAIQYLQESSAILDELLRTQPSVMAYGAELAETKVELALCHSLANQPGEAAQCMRVAHDILMRLTAVAPGNALWESQLADILRRLGQHELQAGDHTKALSLMNRSVELLDEILKREPDYRRAHGILPDALISRGLLLAELGRFQEGLADCDRSIQMAESETRNAYRLDRARVLAQAGDYRRAAREAQEALEILVETCDVRFLGKPHIQAARTCAQAAELARADAALADAERAALSDEFASASITILQQARNAGLALDTDLKDEPEFKELLDRPEFVKLFPNEQ